MKRGKTRKNNHKRNMYGGQITGGQLAPPPYASGALNATILSKLQEFNQETVDLNSLASAYKAATDSLNNVDEMNEHLRMAVNISNKADDVYARSQRFWRSIYGTDWIPPPEPAPAPGP